MQSAAVPGAKHAAVLVSHAGTFVPELALAQIHTISLHVEDSTTSTTSLPI